MTNFERWSIIMQDLNSPQNYIDFAFCSLMSSCLQRRVWTGPEHMPLYPNLYLIFVGEPGIGKGIIIKPTTELLKYHKLKDTNSSDVVQQAADDMSFAQAFGAKPATTKEEPLLFPVAAEATTYEARVTAMARSIRACRKGPNGKVYTHSSMSFMLEEMASLFRRNTEDVVNFLIQAFDCGDYKKETKTNGVDFIKRSCLNILAGTTPDFMHTTFDSKLIGQGFSARVIFVFEHENRKNDLWIPEMSEEQKNHLSHIRCHIKTLHNLWGQATMSAEAREVMDEWWHEHIKSKPLFHAKLLPYFARKQVHVQKLAMALHFGETADSFEIGADKVKHALKMLAAIEPNMHNALAFENVNPIAMM